MLKITPVFIILKYGCIQIYRVLMTFCCCLIIRGFEKSPYKSTTITGSPSQRPSVTKQRTLEASAQTTITSQALAAPVVSLPGPLLTMIATGKATWIDPRPRRNMRCPTLVAIRIPTSMCLNRQRPLRMAAPSTWSCSGLSMIWSSNY